MCQVLSFFISHAIDEENASLHIYLYNWNDIILKYIDVYFKLNGIWLLQSAWSGWITLYTLNVLSSRLLKRNSLDLKNYQEYHWKHRPQHKIEILFLIYVLKWHTYIIKLLLKRFLKAVVCVLFIKDSKELMRSIINSNIIFS